MARNSAGSDDAIHTDRNARVSDHAISDSVPHENKNTEFEALLKLGSQELTDAMQICSRTQYTQSSRNRGGGNQRKMLGFHCNQLYVWRQKPSAKTRW